MVVDLQEEVIMDSIINDAKTISNETMNLVNNTKLLMDQVVSLRELIFMYFEAKDWYDQVLGGLEHYHLDTQDTRDSFDLIFENATQEYYSACTLLRRLGVITQEDM